MATIKSATVKKRAIHRTAFSFFMNNKMTAPRSGRKVTRDKIGNPILL